MHNEDEVFGRHTSISTTLADPALTRHVVRMVEIGRTFYTLGHIIVPVDYEIQGVPALDEIRARVAHAVAEVQPEMVVDTVFTTDTTWANADV